MEKIRVFDDVSLDSLVTLGQHVTLSDRPRRPGLLRAGGPHAGPSIAPCGESIVAVRRNRMDGSLGRAQLTPWPVNVTESQVGDDVSRATEPTPPRPVDGAIVPGVSRNDAELLAQIIEGMREEMFPSQKLLAERLNITDRTYRNWLRDPSVRLTVGQLKALADALHANSAQRAMLYELAGHRPPAQHAGERWSSPDVKAYLRAQKKVIDSLPRPAVVFTSGFDVLLSNPAFRDLFGGVQRHATAMPTRNTTRYVFFHPYAYELLGGDPDEFRNWWLMPGLAHFSTLLQQYPGSPQLLSIKRDIELNSEVRRAYNDIARWMRETGKMYVDAAERPFWHPELRKKTTVYHMTFTGLQFARNEIQWSTFVFDM